MPKKRKGRKAQESTPGSNHAKLEQHTRIGKRLIPPAGRLPNVRFASWLNDRLPEVIWIALLHTQLGRQNALGACRAVVAKAQALRDLEGSHDLTVTGLAALPPNHRYGMLGLLCDPDPARLALRPLLLLPELPAYEDWRDGLMLDPDPTDWARLKDAVETIADHQSEAATDCRWARVMFRMAAGKLHLQSREQVEQLFYYPDRGDLRQVRPFIRATEGTLDSFDEPNLAWPMAFWNVGMRDTPCEPVALSTRNVVAAGTTVGEVGRIATALAQHAVATRQTTDVDARHEAVFGLAAYVLSVVDELLRVGNATGILGRIGLRTMLECEITLAYLLQVDDPETWIKFRNYGAGQAKLTFLKLDEMGEAVDFMNLEVVKALANEDRWQEYQDIGLGHWHDADLRRLAERAGRKAEYDRVYPWTSSFSHGTWSAIRISTYDLCLNPMHRWHRVLRTRGLSQEDVVSEATAIANAALQSVNVAYPIFDAVLGQAT